jgi:hypothetical protein
LSVDPLAVLHNSSTANSVPTVRLRAFSSAPHEARNRLTHMLAGLVPAGHLDDLTLCASELVTNALRAAREYADLLEFGWSYLDTPIHLGVLTTERWTRLDVRDPNPAMHEPPPRDLLDVGGKGLVVVDTLGACRWHNSTAHDKTMHVIVPMPKVELTAAELKEAGAPPPP